MATNRHARANDRGPMTQAATVRDRSAVRAARLARSAMRGVGSGRCRVTMPCLRGFVVRAGLQRICMCG